MKQKTINSDKKGQTMRAYSTPSGGVMFIPDTLEAKPMNKSVSYKDLAPSQKTQTTALDRLEKVARKIAKLNKAA